MSHIVEYMLRYVQMRHWQQDHAVRLTPLREARLAHLRELAGLC